MAKLHPADAEAERIMEIQRGTASHRRPADIITLIICVLLLFGFGTAIFLLPQSRFSEDENRALDTFPEFSPGALKDGSYTAGIGKFYSDQFPGRPVFTGVKAVCELLQLRGQNNGVIPGSGNTLIKRLEYTDYSFAEENLEAVADFRDALMARGIPVIFSIAPRSVDVLSSSLHPLYGSSRSDRIWEIAEAHEPDAANLRDLLRDMADDGEYVWYKTDHHWTTDGAYAAYVSLAGQLGYTPMPESFFTRETVSDSFLGTTYSSSGMRLSKPDSIVFYRFAGDDNFIVRNALTGSEQSGFYDRSYLDKKDKYSAFLGGNNAYVSVSDPTGADKPTLLIVKDSYAHSLAPFLAIHFDLEIIDLRYYTGSTVKLINETAAGAVLILTGADNLAVSDSLTLLRYGMTE